MRGQDIQERWVPAIGFVGRYEVSDLGRVRSLLHPKGVAWKAGPKLLAPRVTRDGRERVYLGRADVHVSRLVLMSFVGEPPTGCECSHLDGDARNNRLSNLAWVTHAENMSHQLIHGTRRQGVRHAQSKLTESDVLEIRRKAADGQSQRKIAADHSVSQSLVSMLARRLAWSHL